MKTGLRAQIVLSLMALMVGTVLLVSTAILTLSQRTMERQAEATASTSVTTAAATMASSLDTSVALTHWRNRANLERLCELFGAPVEGARVTVVDELGAVIATWPAGAPLGHDPSRVGATRVTTAADGVPTVISSAQVALNGVNVATVWMERPLAEVQRLSNASRDLMLLYLGLDALLVLIVGYLLLTRQIVRPLGRVTAAARRVAEGDLGGRVSTAGPTEVAALAASFNVMVERLAAGRAQLEVRLDELADANRRLETAQREVIRSERLATVGQLAAGVAHEVGNPLSAVMGLVELIGDPELLDDDERADTLRRVQKELDRIDATVRELLRFARVDRVPPGRLSIAEPVDAAVNLASHHRRARQVKVVVAAGLADMPAVRGHEQGLVQVLLNLLINAADAMDGRGEITVSADAVVEDGEPWVRIVVRDDGPGVPADLQARVFDPFYTTKAPGEGTGLGLPMCERVLEEYGGRLDLDTTVTDGAAFRIWLRPAEDQVPGTPSGK